MQQRPLDQDGGRPQLGGPRPRMGAVIQGALAKVVAVVVSATLLIAAIAISAVVFAAILIGLVAFGLYLWWKTRKLREQIETELERAPRGTGRIIEGEVIREPRNERGPGE